MKRKNIDTVNYFFINFNASILLNYSLKLKNMLFMITLLIIE